MATEDVFGFTQQDAMALLRLKKTKAAFTPDDQYVDDTTSIRVGYTSGGATARVGTTLGFGTMKIYYAAESGSDRILTASVDTSDLKFYNLSTSAVGTGKYIKVVLWGDIWVCNWEEC